MYPVEEPNLIAFVGMVCSVMGAPTPKRIDIDARVNVFLPGDVVLSIGMPLVAGLNLREFAGVACRNAITNAGCAAIGITRA